jgi:SM-20-related protein
MIATQSNATNPLTNPTIAPPAVKISLMLSGGHQHDVVVPQDSPLLRQLFSVLIAQTRAPNPPMLMQVPLPSGGALAFSSENLVGLVTDPPIYAELPAVAAPPPPVAPREVLQYIQIEDFLPPAVHQQMLDYAVNNPGEFVETGPATNTELYPEHRNSQVIYYPQHTEELLKRLRQVMPQVMEHLGMPTFEVGTIETQLTAHNHGNYYKIHNDNGSEDTATRRLTYVYYFYREPQAFTGGELDIYQTEVRDGHSYAGSEFNRILPKNNSIVMFPSHYMHEVRVVDCPSQAFIDSRFTLNGWVRQAGSSASQS